jgi:hypothetical protein
MKMILRRLNRLEESSIPQIDRGSQSAADLLRERRRRRLEAAGLPYEERPKPVLHAGVRTLSIAETLRQIRQTRLKAASPQGAQS